MGYSFFVPHWLILLMLALGVGSVIWIGRRSVARCLFDAASLPPLSSSGGALDPPQIKSTRKRLSSALVSD
jgi:hypothetical protein